jgi:MFS family permease
MSFTSRWSDVYLASGARAISACGDFLAATALVLALQERGAGSAAVAAVMIAAAVPPVVLVRWTGRLTDRVDSRLLLVGTGLAQAAACVALATVTGTVAIVALVAALGCGLAVTQPTLAALLPAMVRAEDLPKATAFGQTAGSIGLLIAPAAGGLLVGQFGLRVPLLVDAASYLAVVAAGLLIRTRRGRVSSSDVPAAPPRLRSDTLLWSMIVLLGAVVAAVSAVNVAEVFLVRDVLHASTTVFGLLSATWLGAMMIGAWLVARRGGSDAYFAIMLLTMLASTSLVVLLCAMVPAAGWLVPLFVIGGATNGGENVTANVLLARRVAPEARGRTYALYGAVTNGATVIGYLLGGAALTVLPVRLTIALAGGVALAVAAAFTVPVLRAIAAERERVRVPSPGFERGLDAC